MYAQRQLNRRAAALSPYLFIAIGAIFHAVAHSQSAPAALIVDALSYNGSVRSGTATGVEKHDTTTNFPPPNAGIALPATNPPLTPPLVASKNLTMTYTTASEQFPVPGGPLTGIRHVRSPPLTARFTAACCKVTSACWPGVGQLALGKRVGAKASAKAL